MGAFSSFLWFVVKKISVVWTQWGGANFNNHRNCFLCTIKWYKNAI